MAQKLEKVKDAGFKPMSKMDTMPDMLNPKNSRNVPIIGKSRRVVKVSASEAVKGSRKKYGKKAARKATASK
jgi:hypothetical protein